ncbi:nucleoside/nucleotide kinase family protein [Paenibacillus antibioticophila]|uniref:hypothetical protein n=1 Tax=Paenibacillus antibioticophila TaxID=1274374 RepID=UPI0006776DFF|nr:hypothetical protein [Paenibacillus antibioticophila]
MKRPFVVVISGYSGSGKSTLINALSNSLPSCVPMYFDDYASKGDFPEDIKSWVDYGGDPNVIKTPELKKHIIELINGNSVTLNKGNGWAKEYGISFDPVSVELHPSDYIILEEPFGNLREEVREFVDMVIYLDVRPEISLARRVYDLNKYLKNDPATLVHLLDHFLSDYLYGGVREMYHLNGIRVKENANLVVDTSGNLDEVARVVTKEIQKASKAL